MKKLVFLMILVATIGATSAFSAETKKPADKNREVFKQLELFGTVFDRARSDYVEDVDVEKLIENAINGMLASLDPHSSYLNKKTFRDMQVQTRGEFGGLGIEVTMENELVKVVSPIDDTPAARAGVLAGDLITHLDGEQVLGLTLRQAVDKMRGRVNEPIVLTIRREGADKPIEIKVVRDIIRIKSVRFRTEDDVGYLRISQFNEQTADGLKAGIEAITKEIIIGNDWIAECGNDYRIRC